MVHSIIERTKKNLMGNLGALVGYSDKVKTMDVWGIVLVLQVIK
jgi:hypothetical protein